MSVTIRKIAKDLKLAVSTVSKALRDSHEISEKTKRRIFAYAKKLDFVPNPYAGSLKNRTTHNIAVVLPEVADSFFSNAINGIEEVAQAKGYHVMVYLTHENPEREASILRELRSGRVDGVLISVSGGVKSNSQTHGLLAKELPLIFFDRVCSDIDTARVLTDDLDSGYKATEHLIVKGCHEVAFLSLAEDLSIISQRAEGYKKAMKDYAMKVNTRNIIACPGAEAESLKTIRRLLRRKRRPDALVCSVEKLATQAYTVCHELNLSIPHDVRIIAFSNLEIAALLNPPLSTITQPAFEMGKAAATLLFKMLSKKKIDVSEERIILPSKLVERASTK